jgi:hypothetical protein
MFPSFHFNPKTPKTGFSSQGYIPVTKRNRLYSAGNADLWVFQKVSGIFQNLLPRAIPRTFFIYQGKKR